MNDLNNKPMTDEQRARETAARALIAKYREYWPGSWPALPEALGLTDATIDAYAKASASTSLLTTIARQVDVRHLTDQQAYDLGYHNPCVPASSLVWVHQVNAFYCGQMDRQNQQPANCEYNPDDYDPETHEQKYQYRVTFTKDSLEGKIND